LALADEDAGAGTQAWLPVRAGFWPLLQATCTVANEAMDSVQAATKTKTRNFIFFKESFLPKWTGFKWAPTVRA
jgi:hypothetical protein